MYICIYIYTQVGGHVAHKRGGDGGRTLGRRQWHRQRSLTERGNIWNRKGEYIHTPMSVDGMVGVRSGAGNGVGNPP